MLSILDGMSFLAAHNATVRPSSAIDVLRRRQVEHPEVPFLCTVQLALGSGVTVGTISRRFAGGWGSVSIITTPVPTPRLCPDRDRGICRW